MLQAPCFYVCLYSSYFLFFIISKVSINARCYMKNCKDRKVFVRAGVASFQSYASPEILASFLSQGWQPMRLPEVKQLSILLIHLRARVLISQVQENSGLCQYHSRILACHIISKRISGLYRLMMSFRFSDVAMICEEQRPRMDYRSLWSLSM